MAKFTVVFWYIFFLIFEFTDVVLPWGTTCSGGSPGPAGPAGPSGSPGAPGQGEILEYNNWKQCVWNAAFGDDYGTVYTCPFTKQRSDTALYVSYGANMRVYGCSGCCKRYYFTFNDQECSPIPIDGVIYQENTNNMNIMRHRNIQGHCSLDTTGNVDVKVLVGDCSGYGNADAYAGWNSVSRIIIREVPASPY